jgi:hypothetical protein
VFAQATSKVRLTPTGVDNENRTLVLSLSTTQTRAFSGKAKQASLGVIFLGCLFVLNVTSYVDINLVSCTIEPCFEELKTSIPGWFPRTNLRVLTMNVKPCFIPSHSLVVGDVLVNSWGYEQTNVDYYQVTALVGKATVELRIIGKQCVETSSMVGVCTPLLDSFTSAAVFRKRVVDGCCARFDYGCASRKDYQLVDGLKVFKPDRWTAYG